MNIKVLISILVSFVVLLIGVILIIFAAYTKTIEVMYTGIAFLLTASLAYSILILAGLRYWLKLKTEVK